MLDLKMIEKESALVLENCLKRQMKKENAQELIHTILSFNTKRKNLVTETDALKNERNQISSEFGKIKQKGGDTSHLTEKIQDIKKILEEKDKELADIEKELNHLLLILPNMLAPEVPVGKNDTENQKVKEWGIPRNFDFTPLAHWEIGKKLEILDLERGAKLTGSRFYVLLRDGARLERALINFFLDFYSAKGYQEFWSPLMVNRKTMTGTGQLPKFEEDLFKIEGEDYFLIPTAEVPVTNFYSDETIDSMPQKFACFTQCFRKEAGSYGKDTRGIIRVHQFSKVELVKLVEEDRSEEEHEKLLADITESLQVLNLPYQVVLLCSGDVGFSARKCYDIEVWIPSENKYREISSVSNFWDFQARRANIKYKSADGKKKLVHTLNGSGLAVGRTMVAILENYQNEDGTVTVPEALIPYMNGKRTIGGKE
ncbi:MAG TPA: serine--tRNA ligase [Spirochaetia bacterium]|nr:MAG: serine--tRNA ligase [Spirochaetes bacterium GWB1_36_13]HCL55800.1 serine--tRNA ligase [Spirochaetia bacterium]